MSELIIFADQDCTCPVDKVLFENRKYFVRLPTVEDVVISTEIARAGLRDFITWHKLNPIAIVQIVNRVGLLRFFGKVFDVRSEKLLKGLDGKQQFEFLLDDLVHISREIIFDYSSPTSSHRVADKGAISASLLERFNYYRQFVLEIPRNANLESLIEVILRNPHSSLVGEYVDDFSWNANRTTQKTIQSLFRQGQHVREIPASHPLTKAKIRGLLSVDKSRTFFPLRLATVRSKHSFDTTENRFIKHVLSDIENVCVAISAIRNMPKPVTDSCEIILSKVRTLLRRDFFSGIGNLGIFPTSSPTLTGRHGYKDIFAHFLKSRVGAKHIFEDLLKQSLFIDLKNIAQLYEYWVFYSVVKSLLGTEAIVESRGIMVKNGKLIQSLKVSKNNISVAYNETFVRRVHGSYSLTLRPDIVVRISHPGGIFIAVLDAKYRNHEREVFEPELMDIPFTTRAVKADDLQKMHCYVDAIEGTRCAFAMYPGTEFVFFPRDRSAAIAKHATELTSLEGVGAIPLLPGEGIWKLQFDEAMAKLKRIAG